MDISTRSHEGCSIIAVSGRLDHATAGDLERHCESEVEGGIRKVVFDLEEVEYISSAGLRAILTTAKRLKALGGGVAVCSLTGVVEEVFEISGFRVLMPVVSDVDEAVTAI